MNEIGLASLRIGVVVALAGLVASVIAGVRRRNDWAQVAERSMLTVFVLVSLAMAALFYAFATNDFRLVFVADHSARSMPLHYRLAALWGGQAGSLLLWLWMICGYGTAAVWIHRRSQRRLLPWVCAVLLGNALFFLVLVSFVTSPFEKLPPTEVLSDGAGLNPLLQHPAMMAHPVMLYLGFTGFAVPFAFAFAALVTRDLGTSWLRAMRRWTLVPWLFLSIGILLGGRWAYEVLGWGGYWAWDPVENASFMPWIAGTAYLHSVMIQEKRDMLKIWNMVLIGLTYSLCLFGTFLTRSGVVSSVHSFTSSGWFGFIFLGYVLAAAVAYFAFVIARRRTLRSRQRLESVLSREATFVLNNWVFMVILAVVFWGTMFPVLSEAVRGTKIAMGPKFFNTMAGPLALAMLLLTGVGPLIAWRKASKRSLRRQFALPALVAVAVGTGLGIGFRASLPLYPWLFWTLASFVAATIAQEYWRAVRSRVRGNGEPVPLALVNLLRKNQRRYGGYVVHLGVVLILVGIAGSAFNQEQLENLKPGEKAQIDGYVLEYLTAEALPSRHYGGAVARLALYRGDRPLAVMKPEKRIYWLQDQPASIPAIRSTLEDDLYVTLTGIEPDGSATFKIHRNPLVNWIWIGGAIFVLGTLLVIWPHPAPRAAGTRS